MKTPAGDALDAVMRTLPRAFWSTGHARPEKFRSRLDVAIAYDGAERLPVPEVRYPEASRWVWSAHIRKPPRREQPDHHECQDAADDDQHHRAGPRLRRGAAARAEPIAWSWPGSPRSAFLGSRMPAHDSGLARCVPVSLLAIDRSEPSLGISSQPAM